MGLEVGDIVQLNKDDQGINWIMKAEVIHVPRNVGDLWGFRNLATGQEVFTLETFTAYRLAGDATTQPGGRTDEQQ